MKPSEASRERTAGRELAWASDADGRVSLRVTIGTILVVFVMNLAIFGYALVTGLPHGSRSRHAIAEGAAPPAGSIGPGGEELTVPAGDDVAPPDSVETPLPEGAEAQVPEGSQTPAPGGAAAEGREGGEAAIE